MRTWFVPPFGWVTENGGYQSLTHIEYCEPIAWRVARCDDGGNLIGNFAEQSSEFYEMNYCAGWRLSIAPTLVAHTTLPGYLAGMKFKISYFAKPVAPGVMPALLATSTGVFDTVDDARKAAVAGADKVDSADSIVVDPIGERWVKGERLAKTARGWERIPEPER